MPPVSLIPERCPGAFRCGECLRACREGVLMAAPRGNPSDGPRHWEVKVVLAGRCDGCGRCLDACPNGAIVMGGPRARAGRAQVSSCPDDGRPGG